MSSNLNCCLDFYFGWRCGIYVLFLGLTKERSNWTKALYKIPAALPQVLGFRSCVVHLFVLRPMGMWSVQREWIGLWSGTLDQGSDSCVQCHILFVSRVSKVFERVSHRVPNFCYFPPMTDKRSSSHKLPQPTIVAFHREYHQCHHQYQRRWRFCGEDVHCPSLEKSGGSCGRK